MRIEKRWNRPKTSYVFSFVYYEPETRKRVRISQRYLIERYGHPITNEQEALRVRDELELEVDFSRNRLNDRRVWEQRYKNQKKLLFAFIEHQERYHISKGAFNNYSFYLRHYVFDFFLNIKKCELFKQWPVHYDEFRTWLEQEARLIRSPKSSISYKSKDHCITALNSFMKFLRRRRIIDEHITCEPFGSHLYNSLGIEDVVPPDEFSTIYGSLKKISDQTAAFYNYLYRTGCRLNEALGVSLKSLFVGQVTSNELQNLLSKHKIQYYGYIYLDSQPAETPIRHPKVLTVARRPLKGFRKIDHKSARIIPISDKNLWTELTLLFEEQLSLFKQKKYTEDPADYLLFDQLKKAEIYKHLKEAYLKNKIEYKSWHKLRHTRCTQIIGQYNDFILCRMLTGHKTFRSFEKYNHLYEQMSRDSQTTDILEDLERTTELFQKCKMVG